MRQKVEEYNNLMNLLLKLWAEIKLMEKTLRGKSEQVLDAIASAYGRESNEYEVAGGVKWVPYKRSKPKNEANGNVAVTTEMIDD